MTYYTRLFRYDLCAKQKMGCANHWGGVIMSLSEYLYTYLIIGGIVLLIHRMTATFGKLQSRTLELKEGLNIIEAPNETGKSTWCAFLLAMLYGINSRERDKAGFIADKNRYAPWSGVAMSGRLDCRAGTDELSLVRTTRRQTAPMGEFQACYSGTGEAFPGLTGQNCGETLLGISREVFERSAFIRQSGMTITQDAGLERRIAALITSGEEDTSYTEATDALKKQLNRRRHNKTGQIPVLEEKLREIRRQISDLEALEAQLQSARRQEEALSQRESTLAGELLLHDRWEAAQERRALADAEDAAVQAERNAEELRGRLQADHIPENETIGRLRGALVNLETTRKAVDKARAERDEAAKALLRAEAAVSKSPFAGQTAESAETEAAEPPKITRWNSVPSTLTVLFGAAAAFAASYGLFLFTSSKPLSIVVLICLLAGAFALASVLKKRAIQSSQAELLQKRFGTTDQVSITALADTYIKLLEARDAAQAEADRRSATAEALYSTLSSNEQAILLEIRRFAPDAFDSSTADSLLRGCAVRRQELMKAEATAQEARMRLELLAQKVPPSADADIPPAPPSRSRETVESDLSAVRASLAAARSTADRLTGQLNAMGDPVSLRCESACLEDEIAALEGEYEAICLAMNTLDSANTTLQNRFSPELGRRAAEIFSALTDGRYSSVVLDRAFHLSAEPAGDSVYRPSALLSAGTADQLYLAVRLAICDLVLPAENHVPVILDDALASFDNDRCVAALRWLKEESRRRQILLFTCHSREAAFFAGNGEVSVQRLTAEP